MHSKSQERYEERKELDTKIAELGRKLAVAAECIAWYADLSHYDDLEHLKGMHLPDIDRDYGSRARKALAELNSDEPSRGGEIK